MSTREKMAPAGELDGPEVRLWLGVHDLSRVEWTASVGVPEAGERKYEIDFSLEIPASLYPVHEDWDQIQTFSRLQSPSEEGQYIIERDDLDELRRDALGIAHRIKRERNVFETMCTQAATQLTEALHPSLESKLGEIIDRACHIVSDMRRCLETPITAADPAIVARLERESLLADEFLSFQLLEFLSYAERSLDEILLGPGSRLLELDAAPAERLRGKVADCLEVEQQYRETHSLLNPRPDSPHELAKFVERGSSLKKHFQHVLYLDVEVARVDKSVSNWTGVVAAALAASLWFGFTILPIGPGTRAGIGLGTFALLFALVYAAKDRVKELTRHWLTGRLTRLYGQRAVRLRLPAALAKDRAVLAESRETVNVEQKVEEDALNQGLGRTRRVVSVRFKMRIELHANEALRRVSINSIKHIFRHDLSPIFGRLDNAVKRVPVLDRETRRVRFADAPKEYSFPVELQARWTGGSSVCRGMLVVSKRGVERVELASDS